MTITSRAVPALAIVLSASLGARSLTRGQRGGSRIHEIHMEMSGNSYRFAPAAMAVTRGDTVLFVVTSGEPHDVAFDTSTMTATMKRTLNGKIHDPIAPFAGPLLVHRGDRFVMDTRDLPLGEYPFYCLPHFVLQMKGVVTIK
jgi:plastocyanin